MDHSNHSINSMSMSMENAFYSSSEFVDLLFKGFTITSFGGFIAVLIGIVSISILYEGLRQVRDFFLNRFADTRKQAFIYQQQQPSTTAVNIQPRRRRNSNGSGSSTKRCDSIRYFNINKKSPIDDIGEDDEVNVVGPGGDAAPFPTRVQMNPDRDASPGPEPGPSSSLVPPPRPASVSNVRVRVEDLALATLLHMVYITIGYMLMLAVMTFNVWILVSVTVGVGIGYLIFGTFRRLDHLATHKRITIIECCEDGGGDRDRVVVGRSNRSGKGGIHEDSAGPLLRSGSNSVTSSQTSDTGAGYGATTQEKTTVAVAVTAGQDQEEDQTTDTESGTLVRH